MRVDIDISGTMDHEKKESHRKKTKKQMKSGNPREFLPIKI